MVVGLLAGSRTPRVVGRAGMPVPASDAGPVAGEPVVSDDPRKRVEAETLVLWSVTGWVESGAVPTGTRSEAVEARSTVLASLTSVVKREDAAFGELRETVSVGKAALTSRPRWVDGEAVISAK